jgi:hypothetical protein
MATMTNDIKATMTAELKKAGYNSRAVSIRYRCPYGYYLTIRSADVNPATVENIAASLLDSCDYKIDYSEAIENEISQKYSATIKTALDYLRAPENNGTMKQLEGSLYSIAIDEQYNRFSLWDFNAYGHSHETVLSCTGVENDKWTIETVSQYLFAESFGASVDERMALINEERKELDKAAELRRKQAEANEAARIEDEKRRAALFASVEVEAVPEFSKIVNDIYTAKMNNNDTVEAYREEIKAGEFYTENASITDIVTLTGEQYEYFSKNLLTDYDFLSKKGGRSLHPSDKTIPEGADFFSLTNEQREHFQKNSFSLCVKIQSEGKQNLYINPEGYSYVRYLSF